MSKKNKHIDLRLLSLLALCIVFFKTTNAQKLNNRIEKNLQIEFFKDSIEVEENSFEFNNCSFLYTGEGSLSIEVRNTTPSFVNDISSLSTNYLELNSHQQQVIPIRFSIIKNVNSTKWYPFKLNILIKQTGQTIEKTFWIRSKPYTGWKFNLVQPEIFFKEHEKEIDFVVRIDNTGNTEDEYTTEFESELEIGIAKKDEIIILPAGSYRTIKATAHFNFNQNRQLKKATINVYVKNKKGEKRLLVQKLIRIGSTFFEDEYKWKKMPLTIELNSQNIATPYSFYGAALHGSLELDKEKKLHLHLQTNNLLSAFHEKNNNLTSIEYETKKWGVIAGTLIDFNHFLVNGSGVQFRFNTANSGYLKLAALKGRFENTRQFDLKFSQSFNRKLNYLNNSFINLDDGNKTNSYLTTNKLSWIINKNNQITFEAGGGIENIRKLKNDTIVKGPMFGYLFQSSKGNTSIISQINSYSKNFPGLNKGYTFHNHEVKQVINNFFISTFYQINRRMITTPEDSVLKLLFNTNEKDIGLRSGLYGKKISLNVSASILQQQQDSINSLKTKMFKFSVNAFWKLKDFNFSIFSNIGRIQVQERPEIQPFFAFNNFGRIQYKNIGINFRYDAGPFYYFEIKQYAQERSDHERLNIAPFIEYPIKKINTYFRTQLNYTVEKPNDFKYLLLINQVMYTSERYNMDIGFLSSIDLINKERNQFNFTVRKRLQLPVFKNAESNNFTIVLYKDRNNNNVFDKSDVVISNANVVANDKQWLSTNVNGEIDFKNVSAEAITLDFSKIGNLKGWIPEQGLKQRLLPGKKNQKIYIPFKESKTLHGKLSVIGDDKSEQHFNLNNIRITVTDNTGNSYNTLTNDAGEFAFNLPAGDYIVSVNENVFDDNFKLIEHSKKTNLTLNDAVFLTFEIIQKKRQINIKKED